MQLNQNQQQIYYTAGDEAFLEAVRALFKKEKL